MIADDISNEFVLTESQQITMGVLHDFFGSRSHTRIVEAKWHPVVMQRNQQKGNLISVEVTIDNDVKDGKKNNHVLSETYMMHIGKRGGIGWAFRSRWTDMYTKSQCKFKASELRMILKNFVIFGR